MGFMVSFLAQLQRMQKGKNIFLTGSDGYIGAVLAPMLVDAGYDVLGCDAEFYSETRFTPPDWVGKRIKKDIRNISASDLRGIDAVIHLAALSNDPLGELIVGLTEEINFAATVRLASLAKQCGIKRFVYSSSQSMYGISNTDQALDEDSSEKNPITTYARTKWMAECELKKLADTNFTVVCIRPSTVFGRSPALRTDIVYNNLIASAYTTGNIEIKSDGTPWRPVIHVEDVSRAFIAALEAPSEKVNGESFNVGAGNFTVRELAETAARLIPGSTLTFAGEHGKDSRTYRVSFKKIRRLLGFIPEWDLERGGRDLINFFQSVRFTEAHFRGRSTVRLLQIKHLIVSGKIDQNLLWKSKKLL